MSAKRSWGLLPADVKALLVKREWDNVSHLKKRLKLTRPFPITVSLKPPKGNQASEDLARLQQFVTAWRDYPEQERVQWEDITYRRVKTQQIPTHFTLTSFKDFFEYMGHEALAKSLHWQTVMTPLTSYQPTWHDTLIDHLASLDELDEWGAEALVKLAQQLKANMGTGMTLRALPLKGLHTKFLERHFNLVEDMLNVLHDDEISQSGGLLSWLNCDPIPKGWLHIRPLCPKTKAALAGLSHLQLSTTALRSSALPARSILIVENVEPGLSLPPLADTIAVFGGGKNTAWTDAPWLKEKVVAYWGDLDTWGLSCLNDVAKNLPDVTPLMMDCETLSRFQQFSHIEAVPYCGDLPYLATAQQALLTQLTADPRQVTRLEQEYCSADHVYDTLTNWQDHSRPVTQSVRHCSKN